MYAVGNIFNSLCERFNAEDDARKKKIWKFMREAYYELCGETSWEILRDQITYAYNEDDDGMWLPPDVIGIDYVTDGLNLWNKASVTTSLNQNSREKVWFYPEMSRTALASGKGIKITNGATSFTGATAITADHVGEYIRIGEENAFYKLASATTLETPYLGPRQTAGDYYVRPAGTKRIKLLAEKSATDTTAATIYCWRFPEQLFSESQMMLLPRADILELATAEKLYGISQETERMNEVQKNLYGARGRYAGKLDKAISMNPEFIPPIDPRNRLGRTAGYGARRR